MHRADTSERRNNADPELLDEGEGNIVLFYPHIPAAAASNVAKVLNSRWIGQGPLVEEFERQFESKFAPGMNAVAVGSGTDALHLAYLLSNLRAGDEVISPVFTCTATNIPLLYMGVKPVFADIERGTMNIDPADVRRKITPRTRAIVCVHYGGMLCNMEELRRIADEHGLVLIEDAAHALGASHMGCRAGELSDFTIYSFQAIKHITTGDGGMLVVKTEEQADRARRLRWFGIDRKAKQRGIWENDIHEVGYKYQMTDISAAIGLAAITEFDALISHRRSLLAEYRAQLQSTPGISMVGEGAVYDGHAAWMCTVHADKRVELQAHLRAHGIESGQVHFRNDRYSVFGGRSADCENMDQLEDKYLALPLHTKLNAADVGRVCSVIKSGW